MAALRPRSQPRPAAPRSADALTDAEAALIRPIAVGGTIDDCAVTAIRGVKDGLMHIDCTVGQKTVRLDIALNEASAEAMPAATAGKYGVLYQASPEDGLRL